MALSDGPPELPLLISLPSEENVVINGRCTLRQEGKIRLVCVAGLPMHHWDVEDKLAEVYAMVSLVRCGYADQNDVARVFGCSSRTLRRYQRQYEDGGISAIGKGAGRPTGTQENPSAWVRTATTLRNNGVSMHTIAERLMVSVGSVSKWLRRVSQSTTPPIEPTPEKNLAHSTEPDSRNGSAMKLQSFDADPTNRQIDRLLARVGLIDDAEPLFSPGERIPRAGVLLAVPALLESGIFSVAEEVYGRIGPAFYGLRTTFLVMLLMALLRIKRPEALKEHVPSDIGRVLGLDRAPEVKTLRRKLSQLAALGKAELFGRKLAQRRVAKRGSMLGFLYVDGHVRVYHGQRNVSKAYATRLRFALPATTDYWVNDKGGDPVFVVTAEINAGLTAVLPKLLGEVRRLIGKKRATVVFDRGGWSPKLFVALIASGFDILTYRKGTWTKVSRAQFTTCTKKMEGRKISYELNDRNIRLLKGRLRLRQITRLTANGHQTPIVTSRWDLPAVELAYRMFERWRQENFFKYLREEYALDALVDYSTEPEDFERSIPNPERRKLDRQLSALGSQLRDIQSLYGKAAMGNKEGERPTVRGFKIAHGVLGRQIRDCQKKINDLFMFRRD